MKIKTVLYNLSGAKQFDEDVNAALAEGWHLVKREVLAGGPLRGDSFAHRMLYAELAQLDPEPVPEAQPLDPVEALHVVQEFCDSSKCEGCRLYDFCARHLLNNEGPADWDLPGEEAPEA